MITQSELHELLSYDPDTGIFRWKIQLGNKGKGGNEAVALKYGGRHNYKRREICIHQVKYKAHRLAWLYVYGVYPVGIIDHINCDATDNRIANLRVASPSQSQMNRGIRIGLFRNLEDAAAARRNAVPKYHGEFGRV